MYKNILCESCCEFLGLVDPGSQYSKRNIKWFVDNYCSPKTIEYFNDVEGKLVDAISKREDATYLYNTIWKDIVDKTSRSLNKHNPIDVFFFYRNGIFSLERSYLNTADFSNIIKQY